MWPPLSTAAWVVSAVLLPRAVRRPFGDGGVHARTDGPASCASVLAARAVPCDAGTVCTETYVTVPPRHEILERALCRRGGGNGTAGDRCRASAKIGRALRSLRGCLRREGSLFVGSTRLPPGHALAQAQGRVSERRRGGSTVPSQFAGDTRRVAARHSGLAACEGDRIRSGVARRSPRDHGAGTIPDRRR